MIKQARVKLFANDVDTLSDFWIKQFNGKLVTTTPLPNNFHSKTVEIATDFALDIFPKGFVHETDPAAKTAVPSLMLFSDQFDQLHQQLDTATDVQTDDAGLQTFTFADPEGNYFAVAKA